LKIYSDAKRRLNVRYRRIVDIGLPVLLLSDVSIVDRGPESTKEKFIREFRRENRNLHYLPQYLV